MNNIETEGHESVFKRILKETIEEIEKANGDDDKNKDDK